MSVQPSTEAIEAALASLQEHVGGCREELGPPSHDKCWAPAEYVLWGKLIPPKGLGPRCYEHAVEHVGHDALRSRSGYALINLTDLAIDAARERYV